MKRIVWSLILAIILILETGYSNVFKYDVSNGEENYNVVWEENKSEVEVLELFSSNEYFGTSYNLVCDDVYSAQTWTFRKDADETLYNVERVNDQIVFSGTIDNKQITKKEKVGDLAWYQTPGYCLPGFVKSADNETEFFGVRPQDGKVFKMTAKRLNVETIDVKGESVRAVPVKVQLSGLLSKAGSVTYWFRENDLVFIKYKGISFLPGSDATIYELAEAEIESM